MMIVKPFISLQFPTTYTHQKRPPSLVQIFNSSSSSSLLETSSEVRSLTDQFNPKIPIEEALTPPSSWYTHPSFLSLELDRLFYRGWQAVGTSIISFNSILPISKLNFSLILIVNFRIY